jgi:hypothetical protein
VNSAEFKVIRVSCDLVQTSHNSHDGAARRNLRDDLGTNGTTPITTLKDVTNASSKNPCTSPGTHGVVGKGLRSLVFGAWGVQRLGCRTNPLRRTTHQIGVQIMPVRNEGCYLVRSTLYRKHRPVYYTGRCHEHACLQPARHSDFGIHMFDFNLW